MDRQPTLMTPQAQLRPLTAGDWPALYAVAADPQIWAQHPAHDRWQEPVFREFFEQSLASGGGLVVVDPATGALIGHSRYDTSRAGPGEVEIGWTFLARRYWGGATNAAMKRAMLGHALRSVERVIFVVGEHNLRSRRAMEKIGGVLTDRTVGERGVGQGLSVVYAIDRPGLAQGPLERA